MQQLEDAIPDVKESSSTANGATAATGVTAAVAVSAAVQMGAVATVVVLGALADGAIGDRLGVVPLAVVYGLPGLLAMLCLRGREPLLLAAGIATLILGFLPFSVHSFVLGPIGVVYLLCYGKWPTNAHGRSRSDVAAWAVPLLLVAAFLVLVIHDDPVCYTKTESGEVTIDRDPEGVTSGRAIEADSEVVESGCSSDTVVWWEAAASLGLSAAALTAALLLVPRAAPETQDRLP